MFNTPDRLFPQQYASILTSTAQAKSLPIVSDFACFRLTCPAMTGAGDDEYLLLIDPVPS